MYPIDAVTAPRFRPQGDDLQTIHTESRISDQVRKKFKKRGFTIHDYNWHTGSFQVVWRDEETGKLHGVSDPRRLGVYRAGMSTENQQYPIGLYYNIDIGINYIINKEDSGIIYRHVTEGFAALFTQLLHRFR